jgi:hypothetical protein
VKPADKSSDSTDPQLATPEAPAVVKHYANGVEISGKVTRPKSGAQKPRSGDGTLIGVRG